MNKRKFVHYVLIKLGEYTVKTVLIGLTTLFVTGWTMVVYHLMFNNPTITFGGW